MNMLFLTGFMGTGKSAVGRALAERDGYTCDDLDELIEARAGCAISEYMAARGEAAFRDLETGTLKDWIEAHADGDDAQTAVLACGGGIILRGENRRLLRENGQTVRLIASPQSIYQRVSAHPQTRPMLQGGESLTDRLEALAAEREALYRESADYEVSTEGKTAREAAELVLEAIRS